MNDGAPNFQLSDLNPGSLDRLDVRRLLHALGQWGVAEEAGVPADDLAGFASRARDAFDGLLAQAA